MVTMKLFHFILMIIIIIVNVYAGIRCDEFKIIETSNGAIRGAKQITDYKKVDYYSFRGIPYAAKPIGADRFKAPRPNGPWKPNVLDALEFGNICPQLGELLPSNYTQSEDCLFINIYVPADLKPNAKVPVLFFIHGGGYVEGSGNDDLYGPDFFIEKYVILVTLNYRLGVFGFLSLNLPEYSGNMGLKDQQLALKWIHQNIKHFNGDNDKITIFGQSAGGASTHFHILSSESRKYYKNAILMSGVTTTTWAMSQHMNHLKIAQNIATDAGWPTKTTNELIEYLMTAPSEHLVKYSSLISGLDRTITTSFTPVIERSDANEPFIIKSVQTLYETEDINVNTLFTFTSAEMLMIIIKSYPQISDFDALNSNFSIKLPFKDVTLSPDTDEYRAVTEEIRRFYFGNDVINMNKSIEYVNFLSDLNFCYAIDKMVKLQATKSKGKTFYARFDVSSKLNIIKRTRAEFYHPGAAHCDDLCYLFKFGSGKPFYDDIFNSPDDKQSNISIQTIENMTNLFVKFATIDHSRCSTCAGLGFKPIQNGKINFLNITNDGFQPGLNPNGKAMEFWKHIEERMQKYINVNGGVEHNEL